MKDMHRQILFRGKRVDNGEWAYGSYRKVNDLIHYIYELNNDNPFQILPETLGQCTGNRDTNLNWIFEGDIMLITLWTDDYAKPIESNNFEMPVYWNKHDAGFDVRFPEDIGEYESMNGNFWNYAVIGNIHEPISQQLT